MNFFLKIIFLFLLFNTHSIAQVNGSVYLSFRLFDTDGKKIGPYEFEKEVEIYAGVGQMNALIHQKRLNFDDRSYYFNYETDKPGRLPENLYFIKGADTLVLELAKTTANYIVIDQLSLKKGLVHINEALAEHLIGNVSPGRRTEVLHFGKVEPNAEETIAAPPKNKTRIRFSNYMEILNSNR